jgi:23S rRNA pseudouridine2605 synthase
VTGGSPRDMTGVRLNKLLASRGLGARRKCDALIQAGSVRVNGTVVKEPGVRVEPERDRIQVHGRPLPGRSLPRHLMVHKPVGVITTLDDPDGRPTVRRLLPPGPRLFPVGRLDAETSGLLVVTNDGDLAHHLMHPRYGVRKVYRVRTDRPPDPEQLRRLRSGVEFEPRVTSAPCEVRLRSARPDRAEMEIVLHEGRYRQVRRMCEAVGLAVKRLHRAAYGPLRLGTLPRGAWRDLTTEEVRRLRAASARAVPGVAPPREGPRQPSAHGASSSRPAARGLRRGRPGARGFRQEGPASRRPATAAGGRRTGTQGFRREGPPSRRPATAAGGRRTGTQDTPREGTAFRRPATAAGGRHSGMQGFRREGPPSRRPATAAGGRRSGTQGFRREGPPSRRPATAAGGRRSGTQGFRREGPLSRRPETAAGGPRTGTKRRSAPSGNRRRGRVTGSGAPGNGRHARPGRRPPRH